MSPEAEPGPASFTYLSLIQAVLVFDNRVTELRRIKSAGPSRCAVFLRSHTPPPILHSHPAVA